VFLYPPCTADHVDPSCSRRFRTGAVQFPLKIGRWSEKKVIAYCLNKEYQVTVLQNKTGVCSLAQFENKAVYSLVHKGDEWTLLSAIQIRVVYAMTSTG
jgi:hypothetical protein